MFEPKHPLSAAAPTRPGEGEAQAELRPLSWSELNTRLGAARDLRIMLDQSDPHAAASFDAEFARHLAHLHGAPVENTDQGVNLDDLANGKGASGTSEARDKARKAAIRGIR